ncbi:MAG: hypothetical protein LBI14_06325 [Treponema sp.]|jgi:hypothetical protein|nr:hypothetical protein [Treponema sp.]
MRPPALIKCVIALIALLLAIPAVYSQETFDFTIPEPVRPPLAPEEPEEVPRQFRELSLGMSLDELKAALIRDSLFSFRGDRDVSFLPIREETLVETTGLSFIRRAFFQLSGGSVFIMAFTLDTRLVDHYSVYTSLVRRYGEPQYLNPQEAVWESEETRLSIERPLTVKYVDKTVFNALVDESATREADMLFLREEFLGDF